VDFAKTKNITKTFSQIMNEVIIYHHRKLPFQVYDISTLEKEEEAYKMLFEDMDDWDVFNFEQVIEKRQEKIEKLEDPEMEWDDGSIAIDINDGYIRKLSPEQRKEELEEAKDGLQQAQHRQKIYEQAKGGDPAAAEDIVRVMKGHPYSNYKIVKVKNS